VSRSMCVTNNPSGAPGQISSLAFGINLADDRPVASSGADTSWVARHHDVCR
jgi:hypothetical protein